MKKRLSLALYRELHAQGLKRCPKCGQDKPHGAYNRDTGRWDGVQNCCVQCASTRARRLTDERQALINQIKLDRGCGECGYREHPEALDFDHIEGEKVANVSGLMKCSLSRLMSEIAKCEVLCANCHRIRTASRRRLMPDCLVSP